MEAELSRPRVQHHRDGRHAAEPLPVAAEQEQGLAGGLEEQAEQALSIHGDDRSQLTRQREDHVKVWSGKDGVAAALEPLVLFEALTGGAACPFSLIGRKCRYEGELPFSSSLLAYS